jgi:hypothetical protein
MVKQVRSKLVIVRHLMIIYVRLMHVMLRNVGEIHVWAEIRRQRIIWQGT